MPAHPRAAALFMGIAWFSAAACDRFKSSSISADAGPSPLSSAPPPEASARDEQPTPPDDLPPASPEETPRRPLSTIEARRTTLARIEDDRALTLQRAVIAAHFSGKVPSPLEIQRAPLGGGHFAVLLMAGPKERKPLILALDDKGGVLWTKERPLAGIAPGVSEIVLLPGPDAEVRIAWFDPPTRLVAMRAWDAGGGILADYQLFPLETCSALSGLYWPGRGFLMIAAQPGGSARAQLLDEGGRLAWGDGGKALPWISRAGAPVSIVLDTDSSAMALQIGDVEGKDHALAARYDGRGERLWARPLDLGEAKAQGPRIKVERPGDLGVRVTLPPGSQRRTVDITPDGIASAPVNRTRAN